MTIKSSSDTAKVAVHNMCNTADRTLANVCRQKFCHCSTLQLEIRYMHLGDKEQRWSGQLIALLQWEKISLSDKKNGELS